MKPFDAPVDTRPTTQEADIMTSLSNLPFSSPLILTLVESFSPCWSANALVIALARGPPVLNNVSAKGPNESTVDRAALSVTPTAYALTHVLVTYTDALRLLREPPSLVADPSTFLWDRG